MLSIKREGYSIKCSNDIMVAEKFSSSTAVRPSALFVSVFSSHNKINRRLGLILKY